MGKIYVSSAIRQFFILVFLAIPFLSACLLTLTDNPDPDGASVIINVPNQEESVAPTIAPASIPIETNTPDPNRPFGFQDENAVMSGICFEAAEDAAGNLFVVRTALEHIHFYNLADNAELCRRPVERNPFDFEQGRVLLGLWDSGRGCTAKHDLLNILEENNTITIYLDFETEGDCPYDLIRPFWISLGDVGEKNILMNRNGETLTNALPPPLPTPTSPPEGTAE